MTTTKDTPEEVREDDQSFGEIVGNIIENTPDEHPRIVPDTMLVGKAVEKDGVKYSCTAVRHKGKNVGFAPVRILKGDNFDDQLEDAIEVYGSEHILKQLSRQDAQDAMNTVRAKFNKDKVSATTVINAIGAGTITAEMQTKAVAEMQSGKYKTFTDACAAYLGIGEDALKNADASHIHWDCAR